MTRRMPQAMGDGIVRRRGARAFPIGRLVLYYGTIVAFAVIVVTRVPGATGALMAPITAAPAVGRGPELIGSPGLPAMPWPGAGGRGALALMAALGALALALPVAWVHMWTRRFRYDPSLVHTIIVLPVVVAGVVLVVRNSLALAFALAGIVAGVRFRQKLNEPQEAVYVLLALGIGLAAGVQALDVALVLSLVFNVVVLTMWRIDFGGWPSGSSAHLVAGAAELLGAAEGKARRDAQERALARTDGVPIDGMLIVVADDAAVARGALQPSLARAAREWRMTDPVFVDGRSRFEVLVRLRPDRDPGDLMAELDSRWTDHSIAAEYIPIGRSGELE
jgi:hypothetical protein